MKRILILEDKKESISSLVNMIQNMGKEIQIYDTSEIGKAYQIAMERNIDVFLLDIILDPQKPGDMSGMIFADRIRQIEKYKFTPVIFLTGLEDPELHAYKELHCYGYLAKPYDPEKLTWLLEDAMDFSHPREDNRNIYLKKMQDIVYIKSSAGKMLVKTTKDELEISYKSNSQLYRLYRQHKPVCAAEKRIRHPGDWNDYEENFSKRGLSRVSQPLCYVLKGKSFHRPLHLIRLLV